MKKNKQNNIFLVGPMAAGKSTIGKRLAALLGKTFYDTDQVIIEQTGVDLSWIFDVEGEEGFYERESVVLSNLVKQPNIVLATGGGTILSEKNRQLLKAHGLVIYLKADLKRQFQRTQYKQYNRPMLRVSNRQKVLTELQSEREPLYESIADATFSTGTQSVNSVVQKIYHYLSTE